MEELHKRLQEIEMMEKLLGKYHGVLKILYNDKAVCKDYFKHQLEYIRDCLIKTKGLDNSDVGSITAEIEELNT